MLEGEETVEEAVEKVSKEKVSCVEGEDVDEMVKWYGML